MDKRTKFYLDNGWHDATIAEIVGRLEDGEDVAPDELAPIDDRLKQMEDALKALLLAHGRGDYQYSKASELAEQALADNGGMEE